MRVLQVDRVARIGIDLHNRVGIGFQRHAVQLCAATVVGDFDIIVSVSLQADSPCRVVRGDVKGTDLPLVVVRRVVDDTEAIDGGHHLGGPAVLRFPIAACLLYLAVFHLKQRLHPDGDGRMTNERRVLVKDLY